MVCGRDVNTVAPTSSPYCRLWLQMMSTEQIQHLCQRYFGFTFVLWETHNPSFLFLFFLNQGLQHIQEIRALPTETQFHH